MKDVKFKVIDVPPTGVKNRKVTLIGYEQLIDGKWKHQDKNSSLWEDNTFAGLFWKRCQFTRKFDKNKNEIYDGDILSNTRHKAVVYWNEFGAQWIAENREEYFIWNPEEFDNLEVIGNKYQNPKLYEDIM